MRGFFYYNWLLTIDFFAKEKPMRMFFSFPRLAFLIRS